MDYFTRKSIDYLDKHTGPNGPPFFLCLTYNAPYGDLPDTHGEPDHRYSKLYKELPMNSVPREGVCPELINWILVRKEKLPDYDFAWYKELAGKPNNLPAMRQYYSQVSTVDDGVGQVLAKLQNNAHREAHHIPLLIKAPGDGNKQKVVDSLVGTTDIYATVLDYAGLRMPPIKESPARSTRALIENENIVWENACFMEQEETRSIRTKKWLFMKRITPTPYEFKNELNDLEIDPDERNNLAGKSEMNNDVKLLSDQIDKFYSTYSHPK
ncbi:MAG: hypothetical protein GY850_28605 [bacterium]|nr:hypothetical protein [bacterium]